MREKEKEAVQTGYGHVQRGLCLSQGKQAQQKRSSISQTQNKNMMGTTGYISNSRTQHWSKQPVANRNQPVFPSHLGSKPVYLTNTPEPKQLESGQRTAGGGSQPHNLYKTNWQPQQKQAV